SIRFARLRCPPVARRVGWPLDSGVGDPQAGSSSRILKQDHQAGSSSGISQGGRTMSETENIFSGSANTMIALGMVASLLSLALSVWSITRVGELEAFVAVQATSHVEAGVP